MSIKHITTELKDFKNHFLLWFILLTVIMIVMITVKFPFGTDTNTIVSQIFSISKVDLLPNNVELISISPIMSFWVEIKVSTLMSFVLLLPYLLYSILTYLSPALFPKEKKKLLIFTMMASALFFIGMTFSYLYLIKPMFTGLFSFNNDLSVKPFLPVDEYVSWVLASLFMAGILFLLPIAMYMLTALKIVSIRFWIYRWREVFIIFLVIASIITPDVSGVSVLVLTIPMILLYTFGILLAARATKNSKTRQLD